MNEVKKKKRIDVRIEVLCLFFCIAHFFSCISFHRVKIPRQANAIHNGESDEKTWEKTESGTFLFVMVAACVHAKKRAKK